MDDFIAFVRTLLLADAAVRAFFAPGPVIVRDPGGESLENVVEIVLTGSPGAGLPQGEGGDMARSGSLTAWCNARDTDAALGVEVAWPLMMRVAALIAGAEVPATGQFQGGVLNQLLPAPTGPSQWQVVQCRTVEPSGPVNDPDPLLTKLRQTFKVMLLRR